ncbi:hypothetical protein TUM19329_26100 [Legionella antarctica]|uniref:Uncharacterized protein n=1 Tax=Legionella antarctica TaxID=2708020 RepID=A0A6F8T714_9GAMM|nr:hypothetical protein TUM19329_26100 [Legionella antarctica]
MLDEKTIKLLAIVALCHDVARKNDREAGFWEKESAEFCANYLSALGEKTELARLISHEEDRGLLGQILQSANCLDIMRCKEQFDISRMSLWTFFNQQQKRQFLVLIQEQLSLISEQHDLKYDLEFKIMGKRFFQKATRDALLPELKQAYEQADNAYLKTLNGLQDKKILLALYQNQKDTVLPAPEKTAVDGKTEEEEPSKNSTGAFQKGPFLLATKIYPEKKIFSRNFHLYCYANKEKAENQLAIIIELIGEKHPELKEKTGIVENQNYKETPYRLLISSKQEKSLNEVIGSQLNKAVRWDPHCFIEDFILGITPLKNRPRHRQDLRHGRHKNFTVFAEGVFPYAERPSPYPEKQLYKKEKRSQHQSTSLCTRKAQTPIFGHNKARASKLAGVILDADDAMVRSYSMYDGGTVNRPYEAYIFTKAKTYHQKMTNPDNPILFSDRKAFEKALEKNTGKHNEVLARIRWKVTSSSVGIFNDIFEGRCVASYYAERIYVAVKAQYEASGKPWDENYQIPITFYLPGNDKNWTSYSEQSRQEDTKKAQSIYSDPRKQQKAVAEGNGEFLLLLDEPQAVWQSLLDDASHPLLTVIKQGQFQLVEALYQRSGHQASLEDALHFYAETLHQQHEILSEFLFKNGKEDTLLFQAAKSNRIGILIFILDLDRDRKLLNQTDKEGTTPLYTAAYNGHLNIVLALLANKADVNKARKDGATPLHIAAQKGHIDVVLALHKNGADVNKPMKNGTTPLYITAYNGYLNVVLALLKNGADVNKAKEEDGATPLYVAAYNGYLDIVLALLKNGADVNKAAKNGTIPLHAAAYIGHLNVVLALLANKSDVNKTKEDGATPLYVAAQEGHIHVVLALLANKAEVNKAKKDGTTPLHIAACNGHLDVVKALLANKADVNKAKEDGTTPLHTAACNGHLDIVLALLKNGADIKDCPNIADRAARSGNTELLQWIAANQPRLLYETIAHHVALSKNPSCLNIALSLSKKPHSFTLPKYSDDKETESSVKTLLDALDDNFTLIYFTPPQGINADLYEGIKGKLSRNQKFAEAVDEFVKFAKGYYQKGSPVSIMSLDELFENFKQKISDEVPEKYIVDPKNETVV